MNKLYDKLVFTNDNVPALNETNLNAISDAIDAIDSRLVEVADDLAITLPTIEATLDKAEELVEATKENKDITDNNVKITNADVLTTGEDVLKAKTSEETAKKWAESAQAVADVGIATTSLAGLVKPDGNNILVDIDGRIYLQIEGGVIAKDEKGRYYIKEATNETAGIIRPDGSNIKIENGLLKLNKNLESSRKSKKIELSRFNYEEADEDQSCYLYNREVVKNDKEVMDNAIFGQFMENYSNEMLKNIESLYESGISLYLRRLWFNAFCAKAVDHGIIDGITTTASKRLVVPHDEVWIGIFHSYMKTNGTARGTVVSMFVGCHEGMTTTANGVLKQANLGIIGTAGHTATNSYEKDEEDGFYNSVLGLAAAGTNIKVKYHITRVLRMAYDDDF